MSCEVCGRDGVEHIVSIHILADRIAKLEARTTFPDWTEQPDGMPVEPPAAAGPIPPGYKLARGWVFADHPWQCRVDDCSLRAVFYGYLRVTGVNKVCADHAVEYGAIIKVAPTAEQPASAAVECAMCKSPHCPNPVEPPAPAQGAPESGHCPKHPMSIVRAEKTYQGGTVVPALPCEECALEHRREADRVRKVMLDACASAIASKQEAQGAPAEPLSERIRTWSKVNVIDRKANAELGELADECAALEARLAEADLIAHQRAALLRRMDELNAKLAAAEQSRAVLEKVVEHHRGLADKVIAAERDRDLYKGKFEEAAKKLDFSNDAVAAERERCLAHVETYEPRRDVPADWSYQGALARVAEAIRDGRPAPT